MIWNDTYLSQRPGIPKWLCCIASCINFVMAYFTIDSAMTETGLMNKTIPTLLSFFLIYYGLSGVLAILKGDVYVEKIEKEGDVFILTNGFHKQAKFTASEVLSVESSKSSIAEKFFTGFAKHIPGLDLILKDGSKYYITSDMENIDTLKAHLLGKVEGAYK